MVRFESPLPVPVSGGPGAYLLDLAPRDHLRDVRDVAQERGQAGGSYHQRLVALIRKGVFAQANVRPERRVGFPRTRGFRGRDGRDDEGQTCDPFLGLKMSHSILLAPRPNTW